MNHLSINDWAALAREDPIRWAADVRKAVGACKVRTNTAVISWDVSQRCTPMEGRFSGVPYGLKELFDLKGWPTHASSIHPELVHAKAEDDSEVVACLNGLGATCAAKTQMNEFAYGLSGENPHYGNCPHPHLEGCLSGGSSGGSAHLVAGGYLPLAFGTDTGGSIRLPAAWCGLYGFRCVPGYKMGGCFPLAPSFDAIGWFTRTPEDMARTIEAWFDLGPAPSGRTLRGTALIPEDLVDAESFKALSRAVRTLSLEGKASTEDLEALLPQCNQAFNVLQSMEAYEIHREWVDTYGDYYDPAVKARILRARDWTPAQIEEAQHLRETVKQWFDEYFRKNDFLVMPVCPRPAVTAEGRTPELREKILRLTSPASLAQRPALTVPVPLEDGRSVGLQFILKELDGAQALALLDLWSKD